MNNDTTNPVPPDQNPKESNKGSYTKNIGPYILSIFRN
jgi:hypothetical protein